MQDPDLVRRWVADAESQVTTLSEELDRKGRELAEARRRLDLLHEILAAVTSDPTAARGSEAHVPMRTRVVQHAIEILRERGQAMRITDIHAEFVRRGFVLPGRGSPTNLVAHLGATDQVRRISRGVYALPDWELEHSPDQQDAVQEVDNQP